MGYRKISADVKMAAIRIYEKDLMPLEDILEIVNFSASGKHEGCLWVSLGSLERPKDLKDIKTSGLSGDRYIFFQRPRHL
jgi:hypothetical protein